jgi:ATP-dependent Clp protease ATP-binding subunit ClpB
MGAHILQEKLEGIKMEERKKVMEVAEQEVLSLLKKQIRPEFLNRIDEIVMFTPLNEEEIKQIVSIQLNNLKRKLSKNGISLTITAPAIDYIAKVGFDPQFGARPIKRAIQHEILNKLSKQILAGKVSTDSHVNIDYKNGELVFEN